MPNLSSDILSALHSPDLLCSAFTVERLSFTRNPYGAPSSSPLSSRSQTFQAIGCIHPGTPEMLQLLPEEHRQEDFIAVYTDFPLSLGEDHGRTFSAPDRIHWAGRAWRLVRLRAWPLFSYRQALAVLLRE